MSGSGSEALYGDQNYVVINNNNLNDESDHVNDNDDAYGLGPVSPDKPSSKDVIYSGLGGSKKSNTNGSSSTIKAQGPPPDRKPGSREGSKTNSNTQSQQTIDVKKLLEIVNLNQQNIEDFQKRLSSELNNRINMADSRGEEREKKLKNELMKEMSREIGVLQDTIQSNNVLTNKSDSKSLSSTTPNITELQDLLEKKLDQKFDQFKSTILTSLTEDNDNLQTDLSMLTNRVNAMEKNIQVFQTQLESLTKAGEGRELRIAKMQGDVEGLKVKSGDSKGSGSEAPSAPIQTLISNQTGLATRLENAMSDIDLKYNQLQTQLEEVSEKVQVQQGTVTGTVGTVMANSKYSSNSNNSSKDSAAAVNAVNAVTDSKLTALREDLMNQMNQKMTANVTQSGVSKVQESDSVEVNELRRELKEMQLFVAEFITNQKNQSQIQAAPPTIVTTESAPITSDVQPVTPPDIPIPNNIQQDHSDPQYSTNQIENVNEIYLQEQQAKLLQEQQLAHQIASIQRLQKETQDRFRPPVIKQQSQTQQQVSQNQVHNINSAGGTGEANNSDQLSNTIGGSITSIASSPMKELPKDVSVDSLGNTIKSQAYNQNLSQTMNGSNLKFANNLNNSNNAIEHNFKISDIPDEENHNNISPSDRPRTAEEDQYLRQLYLQENISVTPSFPNPSGQKVSDSTEISPMLNALAETQNQGVVVPGTTIVNNTAQQNLNNTNSYISQEQLQELRQLQELKQLRELQNSLNSSMNQNQGQMGPSIPSTNPESLQQYVKSLSSTNSEIALQIARQKQIEQEIMTIQQNLNESQSQQQLIQNLNQNQILQSPSQMNRNINSAMFPTPGTAGTVNITGVPGFNQQIQQSNQIQYTTAGSNLSSNAPSHVPSKVTTGNQIQQINQPMGIITSTSNSGSVSVAPGNNPNNNSTVLGGTGLFTKQAKLDKINVTAVMNQMNAYSAEAITKLGSSPNGPGLSMQQQQQYQVQQNNNLYSSQSQSDEVMIDQYLKTGRSNTSDSPLVLAEPQQSKPSKDQSSEQQTYQPQQQAQQTSALSKLADAARGFFSSTSKSQKEGSQNIINEPNSTGTFDPDAKSPLQQPQQSNQSSPGLHDQTYLPNSNSNNSTISINQNQLQNHMRYPQGPQPKTQQNQQKDQGIFSGRSSPQYGGPHAVQTDTPLTLTEQAARLAAQQQALEQARIQGDIEARMINQSHMININQLQNQMTNPMFNQSSTVNVSDYATITQNQMDYNQQVQQAQQQQLNLQQQQSQSKSQQTQYLGTNAINFYPEFEKESNHNENIEKLETSSSIGSSPQKPPGPKGTNFDNVTVDIDSYAVNATSIGVVNSISGNNSDSGGGQSVGGSNKNLGPQNSLPPPGQLVQGANGIGSNNSQDGCGQM